MSAPSQKEMKGQSSNHRWRKTGVGDRSANQKVGDQVVPEEFDGGHARAKCVFHVCCPNLSLSACVSECVCVCVCVCVCGADVCSYPDRGAEQRRGVCEQVLGGLLHGAGVEQGLHGML